MDCLNGIERIEIDGDCYTKVDRFVIDGLNELETVTIGMNSFRLENDTRKGSKCWIMNCDQLRHIHFGCESFKYYESLELKNLPSLIFFQLDKIAFYNCHSIVFESMND